MVNSFKSKSNYYILIQNEPIFLNKCILSKYYLNPNQWGKLLENSVKEEFGFITTKDRCSGDCLTKHNKFKIEIKISLGSFDGQFNFVQIRPAHDINFYLFIIYNHNIGNFGQLYYLLIPSKELYSLIPEYGGYSHGTIQQNGKIIEINEKYEYSLRPNFLKSGKSNELFYRLLKFRVFPEELRKM